MHGHERKNKKTVWHDQEDATGCWDCGVVLTATAATDDEERPPDAGAVSLCVYCEAVGVFTGKGLESRKPTDEELAEILADPEVQSARKHAAVIRTRLIEMKNPRVKPRP